MLVLYQELTRSRENPLKKFIGMDSRTPKARRKESSEERALRFDQANRAAMDRALAEQDEIDARIRRSIEEHGA